MNEYQQIFDTINLGLLVLNRDLNVTAWNRWMELHSGIAAAEIIGRPLCEFYPGLDDGSFSRSVKSVLTFGNYASYSQKLHKYLIPMKNPHGSYKTMPQMQQHCTLGPIRSEDQSIVSVFITIQDVTDFVLYEQKLSLMSKIDGLTGIYNRRYLDTRLIEELERSRRHGNQMSVMIIDVDHFKSVNDTYGHIAGDFVLRNISEILKRSMRTSDILGRYGGEEFCCIMPETSFDQAVIFAERCREKIEFSQFSDGEHQFKITISCGVTGQQSGDSLESIIRRADEALYEAKITGRNRVCYAHRQAADCNE